MEQQLYESKTIGLQVVDQVKHANDKMKEYQSILNLSQKTNGVYIGKKYDKIDQTLA